MVVSVAIVSPLPHISHDIQRTLGQDDRLATQVVPLEADIAIRRLARADVAVLHNDLPNETLMRLLRTLMLLPGTTMPIIVGAPDDPDLLVHYLEHGVVGYVLTGEPQERLREVVTGVTEGKAYINPGIATRLIDRYRSLRERVRERDHAENDGPGREGSADPD